MSHRGGGNHDNKPFLKDNFATDHQKKLISCVKIPDSSPVDVASAEWRRSVDIGFEEVVQIDLELLQRYSEGKEQPTPVCSGCFITPKLSLLHNPASLQHTDAATGNRVQSQSG
jgi:hypothetical protein